MLHSVKFFVLVLGDDFVNDCCPQSFLNVTWNMHKVSDENAETALA